MAPAALRQIPFFVNEYEKLKIRSGRQAWTVSSAGSSFASFYKLPIAGVAD
jgi:hypothetical protein